MKHKLIGIRENNNNEANIIGLENSEKQSDVGCDQNAEHEFHDNRRITEH